MRIQTPLQHYDLIVVGGGMVGASFAIALSQVLRNQVLSILVVEAAALIDDTSAQPSFDARSTALSYGSSRIFERMGLWPEMAKSLTAIHEIHVSDKGRFGSARLSRDEHGLDALGYVIENRFLGRCLNKALEASTTVQFLCPAAIFSIEPKPDGMSVVVRNESGSYSIGSSLVVLADGGKSPICDQLGITRTVRHYQQQALIANISFEKPHNHIAFERFTDTGPLAVLPLQSLHSLNRGSLVWTLSAGQSTDYMALSEAELLTKLLERFGNRLGKIQKIGERICYPLSLSVAKEQIRPGLVLLGNVAHTLHPVAGQGLNLALRDAEVLADTLGKAHRNGKLLGQLSVLQDYLTRQESDQDNAIRFTHYATQLFSSNQSASVWLRKFGLLSVDLFPMVRREFAKQAMGLNSLQG